MTTAPKSKPSYLLETLSRSAHLYRVCFRRVFVIAFATALLNQLLSLYFINTFSFGGQDISVIAPFGFGVSLFFMLFVMLFGNSLMLVKQNSYLRQESLSFKETFQRVLLRFPGILISGIIFAFVGLVGIALYVLPGLIFMTLFCVYLPALLFAHKKAFESWKFSFKLVKPHFFSSMGIVLLNLILLWIPPELMGVLSSMISADGSLYGVEITLIVIVIAFILPLTNALMLTWFYKLQELRPPANLAQ